MRYNSSSFHALGKTNISIIFFVPVTTYKCGKLLSRHRKMYACTYIYIVAKIICST